MDTLGSWRKSSYSGGGDGNGCVEIANSRTHIAVRDSKTPARATLTFPTGAFAPFVNALKWRKSSYSSFGDGDSCVEIANRGSQVAVRDSKLPTHGTLAFPTGAFTRFVEGLESSMAHHK